MNELEELSMALRRAAGNLTSAAAGVSRVLESVAAALVPKDRAGSTAHGDMTGGERRPTGRRAPAKSGSVRSQKKARAPASRARTSRSSATSPQRTRGRRPPA
jgi:hypothetical protein